MNPSAAKSVNIYEVSPRDGLQNEASTLSTEDKVALIQGLVDAGMKDIEVSSFVRPSWIPQLADAAEVVARLPQADDVRYWGLIPNRRGLERAIDCGLTHVATFLSASETHNQKNLNRTQRETLNAQREVIRSAKAEGLTVRAYISTVFGCPYEGAVSMNRTSQLATALMDAGADVVVLGDTIGMAHPDLVRETIAYVANAGIPLARTALHMHDTRGTAVANVVAGLEAGIRTFDGSIAASAGVRTHRGRGQRRHGGSHRGPGGHGLSTGIDLDLASQTGAFLADALGRDLPGRMHQVYLANLENAESCSA